MPCPIQEMLKFREQAFQKRDLYQKIDDLVENLSEQGVLNAILCVTDIDALNRKMKEFIPQYASPLTSETGKEYCRNVLVSVVLEKVYEEKGADASDKDILDEVNTFIDNLDWIQTFDLLLSDVKNVKLGFYINPLHQSGVLSSIPKGEQEKLLHLLHSVFPLGNPNNPDEKFVGDYSQYFARLNMLAENFDKKFKAAANEYFALQTGSHAQTPFFISKKLRLNINFSKLMVKKAIDVLDWESKEISFATIEAKLNEMQKKRPQYLMLVYVSLMMKGDAALQPII